MSDLKTLLKTTSRYINLLEDNGIKSAKTLLQYFPRWYEDRSNLTTLKDMIANGKDIVMVKGYIISKKMVIRNRKKIYDIMFHDEDWAHGHINIFNSPYLAQQIHVDQWYIIIGKPKRNYSKIIFSHPEVVTTTPPEENKDDGDNKWWSDHNVGRIYPIYSELNGIKPSWFAKKMWLLLWEVPKYFHEYLPEEFIKLMGLLPLHDTIRQIHYPDNMELKDKAIHRIFFDRLLRIQLFSLINKEEYQKGNIVVKDEQIDRDIVKEFLEKLPFTLTNAQKKVTKHIIENLHEEKPMMRLLQWDVGSGKTVVAAVAAYYTYKKFWGQSVFLAPLEVLAVQHYKTLAKTLLPLGIRLELLTWSLSKSEKERIKQDLVNWKVHVIVWTHAVIQEDVYFKDLKFAIIDEQHKFGVKQRAFFKKFGSPHILQMSATPIPRSMALAFFGEFDVSIIDEMPAGRKEIHTKIVDEKERKKLKPWVLTKISEWQKVFIVTPLIEESEKMDDLKAATIEFEDTQDMFSEIKNRIWLLHGRMRPKDKEEVMNAFKGDKLDILVSTTVIEVWVDVPEATIMIVKNAERFGLSQLHQLRWRIWRSDLQSYCFLETKNKTWDTYKRLRSMEQTNDGFKLAELDLQNRGAGEILGTRQSGDTDIPLEILSDIKFLEKVQDGAKWLLENYPGLEWLDALKNYMNEKMWDLLA